MGAPVAKSGAWRPGLASRLRRRVLGPNLRAVGGERGDAGGALDGVVARLRQITVPPLPPPLRRLGTGRRAPADTEREAEEEDLGAVPWHGADEGHFVAAGGGWELALRRFRPAAGAAEADAPPVLLLPGCATNASTFDLAPRVSLARHLARQGLDTWAVELRGIGSSRREGGMSASPPADRWDFDTHLQEDLRAVARFVGECTGAPELSGVGHSMGGMLLLCAAARGSREAGVPPFTRVVTLASCLECPSGESSYGSVAGLRERYPGTAEAVQSKLGATPIPVDGISVVQSMAMGAASGQYASWRKRNPDAAGEAPHRNYTTLAGMLSGSTSAVGSTPAPLLRRLLRNSFEDVPLSLVIQMASLFADGGLRSRDGTPYLDSVRAWEKPRVMCIAANKDGVFSTAAVAATAAAARARYVEVGGKRSGTRNDYNHYDVLVGSQAPDDVFPVISEFLLSSAEQTDADQHHVGASQQSTPRRPPPRPQTAMARQADDPPGETAAQALAASLWQEEDGERADVSGRERRPRAGGSEAFM